MYNKLNQLSFVIGVFFVLMAVILFANLLLTGSTEKINIYSGISFVVFGGFMIYLSGKEKVEQ